MSIIKDIADSMPKAIIIMAVLILVCVYLVYVTDSLVKCKEKSKEKMYTSTKRPNPIPPLMDMKDGAYGVAVTIPQKA